MAIQQMIKHHRVLFAVIFAATIFAAILTSYFFPNEQICVDGLCGKNSSGNTGSPFNQMADFFFNITTVDNWPARWSCGDWSGFQGWTSILSDFVIFISYIGIPLVILYFIAKQKVEETLLRNILKLFSVFILACGFTHLIDTILFWLPIYNISILMKLITGAISLTTLIALFHIFPQLMLYKSPIALQKIVTERTETLADINRQLLNEVEQRQKTEDKLKQSLALNEEMFKEIHHRIKNNLQSIASILYFKSLTMGEEGKFALKGINDRIIGISNVHEMLLHSKSLSSINFSHYVGDLVKHLLKSNVYSKKVETKLNIDESIVVTSDIATNCGLIISECFVNSVRHAVTDGVVVFSVEAKLTIENKVELVIDDNGKGFDISPAATSFVPQFGLSLINTFVNAIQGTIIINSTDKAEFKITFPY